MFIEFTTDDGKPLLVALEHVVSVHPGVDPQLTHIGLIDGQRVVQLPYAQVKAILFGDA